jgi:integrase
MTTRSNRRRTAVAPACVPKPPRASRKHLTAEEWRRLYAAAKEHSQFAHALLALVYDAGLRACEVGKLSLDALKTLHRDGRVYVTRAKGSKSGWWPVNPETARLLREWVGATYLRGSRLPDAPLFPAGRRFGPRTGEGISRHVVYELVHDLGEAVGLATWIAHPHAIRHARVQHLMEAEARRARKEGRAFPLEVLLPLLAQILGHAHARTTLVHYMAATEGMQELVNATTEEMLK